MPIQPSQIRTIDPYSDYFSNSTNKLTRLISKGTNCIYGPHDIDVTLDSSSNTIIHVSSGFCFKDDVLVQLSSTTTLDLTNEDSFFLAGNTIQGTGIYYVCLKYTYAKIKPAPVAEVGVLRPGETLDSTYLLLKVLNVVSGVVSSLYNYNPSQPSIKRTYSQTYVGLENSLPTFDRTRDEGRLILSMDDNEFYFGTHDSFVNFNTAHGVLDTQGFDVGDLIYINDLNGTLGKSIATSFDTLTRAIVTSVGPITGDAGKISLFGRVSTVKIETGITIVANQKVYLSNVNAGTITNVSPPAFQQFIGTAITGGDTTCEIWFTPNLKSGGGGSSGGSTEDMMWMMMLDKSTYLNAYYDLFSTTGTVTVVGAAYNFLSTDYVGDNLDYFTTPDLVSDATSILYRFYTYVDKDSSLPIKVEYSINDGTNWIEIQNNTSTLVLLGFTTLKLKVTWLGSGNIYSYGILYNESMYQALSDTRMLEIYTATSNHSAPWDLVIPNNGIFTNDGKSLEIYRNGVRLIIGEHFLELDEFTIRFLVNILIDDKIVFVEHYGYIDSSVENFGRVSSIISGLITTGNADKVDNHHMNQDVLTTSSPTFVRSTLTQSTGVAPLTVYSATKVINFNSDLLDGYHAGTGSGNIPLNNGTLNVSLNSDLLDGLHASDLAVNLNSYSTLSSVPNSNFTYIGTRAVYGNPVPGIWDTSFVLNSTQSSGTDCWNFPFSAIPQIIPYFTRAVRLYYVSYVQCGSTPFYISALSIADSKGYSSIIGSTWNTNSYIDIDLRPFDRNNNSNLTVSVQFHYTGSCSGYGCQSHRFDVYYLR